MNQFLKLSHPKYGDIYFLPETDGTIELRKLTDDLTILILYFENLEMVSEGEHSFEDTTGLMLTNFPVHINDLNELDGLTIDIQKGWKKEMYHTMLSIWDGEPINYNTIRFQLNNDGSFTITWTGFYGDWEEKTHALELLLIARPATGVITPLCENREELIRIYSQPGHNLN